jgi:hypothetical protein
MFPAAESRNLWRQQRFVCPTRRPRRHKEPATMASQQSRIAGNVADSRTAFKVFVLAFDPVYWLGVEL